MSKGTYCTKCPESTSLQMGCSARVSQNSQASKATFSSGSWVRWSMYYRRMGTKHQVCVRPTALKPTAYSGLGLSLDNTGIVLEWWRLGLSYLDYM